jgi:hypothetical protein
VNNEAPEHMLERLKREARERASKPGAAAHVTPEMARHARESIARADAFLARTAPLVGTGLGRERVRLQAARRRGDRRLGSGRPAARRTSRAARSPPSDPDEPPPDDEDVVLGGELGGRW